MATWQLQDAKNRFSQLINDALREGPQIVTRRGEKTIVVMAYSEFEAMSRPRESLVEFFRNSPMAQVELPLERDRSPMRDVDLS
ncbi:MAG: type II toxin-antitoxin system Phd/YefM family antitoxin [Armatimonadetes bacterium]|nr:type II toxin-antitoxin system Phd/YefM family antitoxin [Armatimonadota bacterium]